MTRLPYLAAVVVVITYEAVAVKTKRAPTITRLIHEARRHFQPPCPQCGNKVRVRVERDSGAVDTYLVRRDSPTRPRYRGWHTARPS